MNALTVIGLQVVLPDGVARRARVVKLGAGGFAPITAAL